MNSLLFNIEFVCKFNFQNIEVGVTNGNLERPLTKEKCGSYWLRAVTQISLAIYCCKQTLIRTQSYLFIYYLWVLLCYNARSD